MDRPDACISAIQRFSTGDGPGIRTTLFFQGCNLTCPWCHNPETIALTPMLSFYRERCGSCGQCQKVCPAGVHQGIGADHGLKREACIGCGRCVDGCSRRALALSGRRRNLYDLMDEVLEDEAFYRESGGGVTFSGGEPLLQAACCAALGQDCADRGISVLVDTAGTVDYEAFRQVLPFVDRFYYDIKGACEKDYQDIVGGSFLQVLANLKRLIADGGPVTVRIPVIPGYSDTVEYCLKLREMLGPLGVQKLHLLPFHRMGGAKYAALEQAYAYRNSKPPEPEQLYRLLEVFKADFDASIDG